MAPPILGTSTDGLPEGSIGAVTPFYEARVASAEGSADGMLQGELQVFGIPGRTLALGYVMVDGTFANLPMTDDGWFRTGDVVETDSQGWIRFLGRADDVLNIGGASKLVPDVVAAAVHGIPGLSEHFQMVARLAGHLDQLLVRVERLPGAAVDDTAVADALRARLDEGSKELRAMRERGLMAEVAVEVLPPGGLPRNPRTGKIPLIVDERQQ